MDIQNIEETLRARYVDSYASGHMGSRILRFRRDTDKNALVVKFAPMDDVGAIADFEANIHGYSEILTLGGSLLVPPELKEIPVTNGRALVMRDLGASMRIVDGGFNPCMSLWEHFRHVVLQTAVQVNASKFELPQFMIEVAHHIERFSHGTTQDLLKKMRESDWTGEWGKSAIMLLDFTPDNLFVNETRLSFIDPWSQETYLGHPAVSIGQFATLMQLYRMRDADKVALILKERCIKEMPSMLGCDMPSVERAFRVGSTLQFVLSSYVRRESKPSRATELAAEAHKLWR